MHKRLCISGSSYRTTGDSKRYYQQMTSIGLRLCFNSVIDRVSAIKESSCKYLNNENNEQKITDYLKWTITSAGDFMETYISFSQSLKYIIVYVLFLIQK